MDSKRSTFIKEIIFPVLFIVILTHLPISIMLGKEFINPQDTHLMKFFKDYIYTGGALITSISMIVTSIVSYKSNPLLKSGLAKTSYSYPFYGGAFAIVVILFIGILNYTEILATSQENLTSLKTGITTIFTFLISIASISYVTHKTYYSDAAQQHLEQIKIDQERISNSKNSLKGKFADD